jgi:hypothetical protein
MDEDPSGVDGTEDGDPAKAAAETDAGTDAPDPAATESTQTASTETEEPPGADPDEPVSDEAEPDAKDGSSGSPDMQPPKTDDRAGAGGIPRTTTTGDPDKDVGGPSVTEESRRQMEGDRALDEPGYGDLGHAEDFRILRDD